MVFYYYGGGFNKHAIGRIKIYCDHILGAGRAWTKKDEKVLFTSTVSALKKERGLKEIKENELTIIAYTRP